MNTALIVIGIAAGLALLLGAINNVVTELRRLAECAEREERRRAAFDEAIR